MGKGRLTIPLIIIALILIVGILFFWLLSGAAPSQNIWKLYVDDMRNFSIQYPENIAEPDDQDEPTTIVFRRNGDLSSSSDFVFSVWTYPTEESNIHGWIKMRKHSMSGATSESKITGTTTVNGAEAVITKNEYIYAYSFVTHDRVWKVSFDRSLLSKKDMRRMIQSFQVTSNE